VVVTLYDNGAHAGLGSLLRCFNRVKAARKQRWRWMNMKIY
jgi:hypothetical protein